MSLNLLVIADNLNNPIITSSTQRYIDEYRKHLSSLTPSRLMNLYNNERFETWIDKKKKHYMILLKKSNVLRFYQRLLPGTNVLIYFINMNEQKNYSLEELRKWKIDLNWNCNKELVGNEYHSKQCDDPQHPHPSYQSFQRMIIGLSHFIYPSKYIVFVLCGAVSSVQFFNKKKFILETYSDIIFKKCQRDETKTLIIEDEAFNAITSVKSDNMYEKLTNMIQQSILQNSPEIIATSETKTEDDPNVIICIFDHLLIKSKNSHVEMILFCSVLNGTVTIKDKLMLYPANIEIQILDMRSNDGHEIKRANSISKISIKIRISYDIWNEHKKFRKGKYFLVSNDCINNFQWQHINVSKSVQTHKNYTYCDETIEIKLLLASINNYQKGIYRNQELLISYLGYTYPVHIVHRFDLYTQPSVDNILEWNMLYIYVFKIFKLQLSNDCIRTIFYYILPSEEWNLKIGLLQKKTMNIKVTPLRTMSFSIVKPFNKFCILARNEIVGKGKFLSTSKLNYVNLDCTIFDLTKIEKSCIMKWIPNIWKYSEMKLIHRGSRDGFDTASFEKNCENKRSTLCIIQSAETGEIFGGYHHMPIPSGYGYRVLRYWNVMNFKKEWDYQAFIFMLRMNNSTPCMFRFGDNYKQQIYPHIHVTNYYGIDTRPGIRFGKGCYLINQCDTNLSCWMPQQSAFQHPQNDITEWNKITFPQHFTTKDYEIWQLIQ
eukprot:415849_1